MDLKKVLDQTVRELKREVNKKVLKVPEIEQKVLEATSNEPWGPHGTLMADIAQATRNFNEYQMIMGILWKRLNDSGKNWRHVYKALTLLEFLISNGAERIIDEFTEHAYQVQTLVDFQYLEPSGKDQGINVRKKAQTLVALLNDKEKIREARQKAAANRDKYRGVSSTGSIFKPSSYSSTGGGYGGDRDEERLGTTSRYGGRDDDRYGTGRERDGDRQREDDRYGRDGDRSSKDDGYLSDRDRYEDDRFRVKGSDRQNDKYGGEKYDAVDKDRSFEDDDRSYRGTSGGKAEEYSPDERRSDQRHSKGRVNNPPNYEDLGNDTSQGQFEDRREGGLAAAVARASSSSRASGNLLQNPPTAAGSKPATGGSFFSSKVDEDFDDFNPRQSVSGPATGAPRAEDSVFGQNPQAASASITVGGVEDLFSDGPFQTAFVAGPASTPQLAAPPPSGALSSSQYTAGDPFAGSSGSSASAGSADIFGTTAQNLFAPPSAGGFIPAASVLGPSLPFSGTAPASDTGGAPVHNQLSSASAGGSGYPLPSNGTAPVSYGGENLFGGSGFSAFEGSSGGSNPSMSVSTQQVPPVSAGPTPPIPEKQKKPFEQKSRLWADTLSTGLVNLDIEGPKSNPLAELGIDLKSSSLYSVKKKAEKPAPTSMGKAMGSGTGLGLAAASNLTAPPGPSMVGMGAVGGGGMGLGVGMGLGPGHNMGVGMGVGMGPGYGVGMPSGMAGGTHMGMGFVGAGPAGGLGASMGSTPWMGYGVGGYPNQQFGGMR